MLRMKQGDASLKLLKFIGVCGEIPMTLLRQWDGYYDYNRRLVTRLVREGYLRERKLRGYHRSVVRSLSLAPKGLKRLEEASPGYARVIREQVYSPGDGHGDWKRTLHLHRGAWCFLTAMKLGAVWVPGKKEEALEEGRLTYFTVYELNRKYGWDSKGVRASGVFCTPQGRFVPTYYLGGHNMYWNQTVEDGFRDRLELALRGYPYYAGDSLFLSSDWGLAENLVRHGVNPRTRLIRPGSKGFSYCLPVDENGLLLAEMVLDESLRICFQKILKEYGFPFYGPDMPCLFELNRLARFVRRPGKGCLFGPNEGHFFGFQMETMKRLNDAGAELRTIPEEVLDEYIRRGVC